LLKQENLEIEELKHYSKLIHDKLNAVRARNLNDIREFMRLEAKEEKAVESHVKNIVSGSLRFLSKKDFDIKHFKRDDRVTIVAIKGKLKKLKKIMNDQIELVSRDFLSNNQWTDLEKLVLKEANLLYDLSASDFHEIYNLTFEQKKKLVPETVKYLSVQEVIDIHDETVRKWGGLLGVRDVRLLDSAVNRPKAGHVGGDFYVTIYDKAAALLYSIVQNQPFNEGNTRAAVYSTVEFLKRNGVEKIDVDGLWKLTKSLADTKRDIPDIKTRIMRLVG
jgi:death-on-curing protein